MLEMFVRFSVPLQLVCFDHADEIPFRLLWEALREGSRATPHQCQKQIQNILQESPFISNLRSVRAGVVYDAIWRARGIMQMGMRLNQTTSLSPNTVLRTVFGNVHKAEMFMETGCFVSKVAFSPDMQFVLVLGDRTEYKSTLFVRSLLSSTMDLKLFIDGVCDAAFGSEGGLTTSHPDGLRKWTIGDTATLQQYQRSDEEPKIVMSSVSLLTVPRPAWVWDGSRQVPPPPYDRRLKYWTLSPLRIAERLSSTERCDIVCTSPDGRRIAWNTNQHIFSQCIDIDGLWQRVPLDTPGKSSGLVNSLGLSNNGNVLAAVWDDCYFVWFFKSEIRHFVPSGGLCGAISPDGHFLALLSEPHLITVMRMHEGYNVKVFERCCVSILDNFEGARQRIIWSPDGWFLAVAWEKGVTIVDVSKEIQEVLHQTVFDPDI